MRIYMRASTQSESILKMKNWETFRAGLLAALGSRNCLPHYEATRWIIAVFSKQKTLKEQ